MEYKTTKVIYVLPTVMIGLLAAAPYGAWALGIGEADLKSHLGQPLRVHVQASDIDKKFEDSCFKSTYEINGVQHKANLRIVPQGDDALLQISSNETINEPVVNLVTFVECDVNIQRDYVLLLDPPSTAPVVAESNTQAEIVFAEKKTVEDKAIISESSQAEEKLEIPPPLKQKRKKTAHKRQTVVQNDTAAQKKSHRPQIILEDDPANKNVQPKKATEESKPRLSISSGNIVAGGPIPAPVLRLDNQLQERPIEANIPLSSTDVLDEATALSNRLANLERQIVNLQKRNTELEQEKALRLQAEIAQKQNEESNTWWQYLAMATGVIGLLGAIEWWRRRKQAQLLSASDLWVPDDTETEEESIDDEDIFATTDHPVEALVDNNIPVKESAEIEERSLFDTAIEPASLPAEALESLTNVSAKQAIEIEEHNDDVHDDIIENAEVFIAHNRPQIAIQLLQNHLQEQPTKSVVTWLFLLDLLTKEGLENDYHQAVLSCRKYFNVKLPEFNNEDSAELYDLNRASVEDYPHVVARLKQVWGTSEALPYIEDLVLNRRDELRIGFEKEVFEDILFLRDIASDLAKSIAINSVLATSKETQETLEFTTLPKLDNTIEWEK